MSKSFDKKSHKAITYSVCVPLKMIIMSAVENGVIVNKST